MEGKVVKEAKEQAIAMRDAFREIADILDEMIVLDEREEKGEDVTQELENLGGKFFIKLMRLQTMANAM